jgi:DNA-binding NtrC family response regulator
VAKILIVDDDAGVLGYLTRLLGTLGHTVETAEDGAVAVERATDKSFQMIISDLNLPGEPNRLALIRRLRELRPECPLVVISGYPTQDRLDECREMGVTEFLTKPFEINFIKSVLRRLFEGAEEPPSRSTP